ncbi:hypothetical protein NW766_011521 [Fusarium irregulare]|uniref:Uncharacterized protein n=1 Tax=Fusarium irregulare TaxID=2494466 RepID=A0A9W8PF73_9HYPO|nr:hypothetical protein NW766_011521 [Fusarium irregulare]
MNSLLLNGVGMRSLSAAILRHCSTIFAHYAGLPGLNYENAPSLASGNKVLWLHFILDEREKISEIWTWKNPISEKGIVDALHRWDHRVTTKWEHIADLPPDEPTTIFLEESWDSIGQLALQSEAPIQGAREPPIENVTVEEGPDNQPDWVAEYSWGTHYSSAPLSGLSTITPYWGKTRGLKQQDVEGVLGLILRYNDGRARVLGQVRLDSLGEPLDVTNCDGISLKYVWEEAVLENVQLGRVGEDGWMWMPLEGSMTWWFDGRRWGESYWSWTSSYYCFIKHFG